MSDSIEDYADKSGRVNVRKLFDALYPVKGGARVKSDVSPKSQTSRECESGNGQLPSIDEILPRVEALRKVDKKVYYVAEIQLMNACRVSEVLGIRSVDITKIGSFQIRGKKGSCNRMGVCANSRDYLLRCRQVPVDPFKELDRWYILRCYKKVGLYGYVNNGKHRVITHLFRHIAANSANAGGIDLETVQKQLGHKSRKSTSHYVQGSKE